MKNKNILYLGNTTIQVDDSLCRNCKKKDIEQILNEIMLLSNRILQNHSTNAEISAVNATKDNTSPTLQKKS